MGSPISNWKATLIKNDIHTVHCVYIQNVYISLTYRSLDAKTGIPSCQWTYRCLCFEGLASLWRTWAGGQHLTDGTDGSRGVSTEVQREVNMTVWGVVWTSSERRVHEKMKRRSSLTHVVKGCRRPRFGRNTQEKTNGCEQAGSCLRPAAGQQGVPCVAPWANVQL